MLTIPVDGQELYDDATGNFIYIKPVTLQLEHSLISVRKWESKWKKSFISKKEPLNPKEFIDYVRCMTINQNVDPNTYLALTPAQLKEISEYMTDEHTATTITDRRPRVQNRREIITCEQIYAQMVECGIDFACEKWHLNQLLTLIRICYMKHIPQQKMGLDSIYAQNKSLNDARRRRLHSRG